MYAQNDNEIGEDFYNSVFYPVEAKMCLGLMSFCAPSAALKQKKLSLLPEYATNGNLIPGAIKVYETSPFDYRIKLIKRVFFFVIGMHHFSRFFYFL